MEHPGFSLSVVLRYVLLPAAVLGLITLWHLKQWGTTRCDPHWAGALLGFLETVADA